MGQNPMEVRPIRSGEHGLAMSVIGAALTLRDEELDPAARRELSLLPNAYRDRGGEFWLALVQGTTVGTIGSKPRASADGEWEVTWITLVPNWRGMGMGRMLAEKAIDFARQHQATRIVVKAHTAVPQLLPLFQSLHFQVVESIDFDTYSGPYTLRRVFADRSA